VYVFPVKHGTVLLPLKGEEERRKSQEPGNTKGSIPFNLFFFMDCWLPHVSF